MGFFTAFEISSSALSAQRTRMDIVAANLANAETTRTPEGGPYQRREVVFQAAPLNENFQTTLGNAINEIEGVEVSKISIDPDPSVLKYDPGHPDADAEGFVHYPNINLVKEMVDMISATRSYQANIAVFETSKD